MSGQRFVDRVVDHFVDEMMQTALAGVADIHAGPLAHRFQALQNFYVFGAIFCVWWIFYVSHFHPSSKLNFVRKILELGRISAIGNSTGIAPKSKAPAKL